MTKLSSAVFSEYEVAQMNVIFANGDYGTVECMAASRRRWPSRT